MSKVVEIESVSKKFEIQRNRPFTLKESIIRRLKGVHDPIKTIWALRDVSFSVEKGKSLGIIGHNGAGKSTLLRLICGLGRPTSGRILRIGQVSGLLELGSGFHPDMTGRENIVTGGLLNGLTIEQVKAYEDDIIAFAELEDFIDQPVRTYSKGMYLRLAFSTAMQFDPELLVIDEVLTVGDTSFKAKCYNRLAQFRSKGKTMIIVSHSMEEIEKLCDEVIVLEEGCFVMKDAPSAAINNYYDLMHRRTERRAAELYGSQPYKSLRVLEQGSRIGTNEAEIASVAFYDSRGENIDTFYSGDSITIKLDYKLSKPLSDMALTLAIFNELNVKCFETQIPSVKNEIGPLNDLGSYYCNIPQLNLLPNPYYVNVGLYPIDWDYAFDFHFQMHVLNVISEDGDQPGLSGIVSLNPNWTLSKPNKV
jgi:lipopolysaccharide transport system ATP-binding protein